MSNDERSFAESELSNIAAQYQLRKESFAPSIEQVNIRKECYELCTSDINKDVLEYTDTRNTIDYPDQAPKKMDTLTFVSLLGQLTNEGLIQKISARTRPTNDGADFAIIVHKPEETNQDNVRIIHFSSAHIQGKAADPMRRNRLYTFSKLANSSHGSVIDYPYTFDKNTFKSVN